MPSTDLTSTVLAPNPGPMTLQGTNSYLIRRPGASEQIVVDPGPADANHLAALTGAARVVLILISHRHADHTEGARALHEFTGAPVRAADPAHCYAGGQRLTAEVTEVAGVGIEVVPTPGHTDDSVSFWLPEDGPAGSMLTGDTILGSGTTVITHPDGDLAEYFASLDALQSFGPARVLPGHGPQLPDLAEACRRYREHRQQRLDQVRAVMRKLGVQQLGETDQVDAALVEAVVATVYADSPAQVREAARQSVTAQLLYLSRNG